MRRFLRDVCAAACLAAAAACGGSPIAPPPVAEGPAVHSITPNTGATTGGSEVTIRGLRFASGATVTIGGRAATDVAVQSGETLTARTPAGAAAGAADVVVSVGGRSGSLTGGFTYQVAPPNAVPVITSITARGSKWAGQPENFADLNDSLTVSAAVTDPETPADQLEYHWTATLGTFSGTGSTVTWKAPASAPEPPVQVTIALRVVERYGAGGIFQQEVTGTRAVALHDSVREIGGMAVRFLDEFSKPQTNTDWRDVMKDFSAEQCPERQHVDAEQNDVENHIANFTMQEYTIGAPSVTVHFGLGCVFIGNRIRPGDACVSVRTNWRSTDKRDMIQHNTIGIDHLSAVYSRSTSRWWLCSSDFENQSPTGHAFYSSSR